MRLVAVANLLKQSKSVLTKIFANPSAYVLAEQELYDARRYLLMNQSAADYHLQMTVFYQNSIDRLEKYLDKQRGTKL
jgi:hypothetical protein